MGESLNQFETQETCKSFNSVEASKLRVDRFHVRGVAIEDKHVLLDRFQMLSRLRHKIVNQLRVVCKIKNSGLLNLRRRFRNLQRLPQTFDALRQFIAR